VAAEAVTSKRPIVGKCGRKGRRWGKSSKVGRKANRAAKMNSAEKPSQNC